MSEAPELPFSGNFSSQARPDDVIQQVFQQAVLEEMLGNNDGSMKLAQFVATHYSMSAKGMDSVAVTTARKHLRR